MSCNRKNLAPQRYKYLKQSVVIGGFGSAPFKEAIRSVAEIHKLFDRCFPEGTLEAMGDYGEDCDSNCDRFDSANRYFTAKDEARPGDKHVPFGKLIDPNGVLENMVNDGYLRTEDNVVEYFKRRGNEGNHR